MKNSKMFRKCTKKFLNNIHIWNCSPRTPWHRSCEARARFFVPMTFYYRIAYISDEISYFDWYVFINWPYISDEISHFDWFAKLIVIGTDSDSVRYSIYSGDPNGYFSVHPVTGVIRTNAELDHETHPFVLLNVAAMTGEPPTFGHSQVNVSINCIQWPFTFSARQSPVCCTW